MTHTFSRRAVVGAAAAASTTFAAGLRARAAAPTHDFAELDAIAQAELVKTKQVKPIDLVNAAIARIESLNPRLNAVVTKCFDVARKTAQGVLPASPLSGVPYLVKDLDDFKGVRTTGGSRLFADQIATRTSPVPQSAVSAGMVVLGKSNTPEFGLLASTESVLLGACHNPWKLDYSPGGSSGGAAAAVASGIVPVAHASDGGGSIRIPASACGIFGMKPSRGRFDLHGENLPGEIAVENCVSRTVRDSAMMFALSEDRSPKARLKPIGFVSSPAKKRLRIAFNTLDDLGMEPHADVRAALEASAKLCADLGHTVEPVKAPVEGEQLVDAFLTVWAEGPTELVALARKMKKKPEDVLEPWTLGLAEFYAKKPKDALAKSLAYFKTVEATVAKFMSGYDVWLTPVLAHTPPMIGEQAPTVAFPLLYDRVTKYATYTPIHNIAGTPAMSVPLGMSKDGLPIGSQFAAAKGGEAVLFALAYELERAQPWAKKHPPVFA
jgi:amidase